MLAALALLFLCSGFSALVYQIVWLRVLALVFGVTVYAASAVLTSFMGGLALGSWLGGRAAERVRRPLVAFALVEVGIGLSALAVPVALDLAQGIYVAVNAQAPDALPLLTFVRLVCAAAVLLVPTTLMGASLPLVSRHVALLGGAVASRIGILYAANTTGGIAGTLLAGFVLIGGIGVVATTRLAVAVNIGVGLAAFALARTGRLEEANPGAPVRRRGYGSTTTLQRGVLAVLALAGFAGLALEVVWFRILVLFIPATTYAFTTMLATVLLGIAIGSAWAAARLPRLADPVRALARVQIATGILAIASMTALVVSYRLGWRTSGMVQACIVAMLPATILMGATFPIALAIWLGNAAGQVGRRVGVLYAVNVCGAVAGALAGGFLLLPFMGSRASLLLLAAVYACAGCLLVAAARGGAAGRRTAMAAAVLWVLAAVTLPDIYGAVLERRYGHGERIMFRAEGVQTTATVHFQPNGQRVLYLDGLHQANDSEPMVRVHAEIGHLPMVLHPDPTRALVIGLGGGVTPGAVSVHGTLVDVVELGASVVAAAPYFAHVNGNLLARPNVRIRVDDGRNYLLTTPRRYDVLTADIIQPIHAGAGNLYSREYFTLARNVLADGGLMMQWIGHREEEHYKRIMRTFLDVFPDATLWGDGTLMLGSTSPLRFSREAFDRHLADPDIRYALARVRLDSFEALRARFTAGPDEMRRFVGDGPVLTDDRPILEYHRSLASSGPPVDVSELRGGDVTPYIVDLDTPEPDTPASDMPDPDSRDPGTPSEAQQ